MHRRWFVNRTNPEYLTYVSKAASISPVLAQILINRGIKTSEEIGSFLNPHISNLSDPFEMQGMNTAVERIIEASRRGEKVLVHGDYDVDGLSATAILHDALRKLGIDSHYYIPNRLSHGYGFHPSSVEVAKQTGASLVITVDCGITSFEAVDLCKRAGIDVIITDHHEPLRKKIQDTGCRTQDKKDASCIVHHASFEVPDALSIINPKISHQQSPVSHLSGAGVAFKLAHALAMMHDSQLAMENFLDLAALGTMADVVPITGENRLIVKEGLRLLEKGNRQGLKSLMRVAGIEGREPKPGLLLFTIIPRMNAAGRISDSHNVIELLLTDSENEAFELSGWLDKLNTERQEIEVEVQEEAMQELNRKGVKNVIVLSSEGWHKGIMGIVASRIAEAFYRPTLMISRERRTARGSGRSIPTINLYELLTQCSEFLTNYGGHKHAVGFSLESRNISSFEDKMNKILQETLSEEDLIPSLEIDADVEFTHVNFNLIREIGMLEPFGSGNPEPRLGSKRLEVLYPRIVGNNHLKMKLKQGAHSIDTIGFDMATFLERIESAPTIDAVFTPCINEWEGAIRQRRSLQLNLKGFRPSL